MTGDRVAEIAARLEAATPGPWRAYPVELGPFAGYESTVHASTGSHILVGEEDGQPGHARIPDADLIANAPADLAYLLDENARLRAQLDYVETAAEMLLAKQPMAALAIRAALNQGGETNGE